MNNSLKNLHLGISAAVVIGAAIIYGSNPGTILPLLFDFTVENLELKNIFRAIMGLYGAFAVYWIVGTLDAKHWRGATMSNVLFMGGLAFGRMISTVVDGISVAYTIGCVLELLMMFWGIYNLKKEKNELL